MNDIEKLTVRNLLGTNEYRIPIYQRNYAWGIGETTQLVQDIADYAKDSPESNYYIGNLIVFPRYKDNHLYFETIDGQQRITTLTILICALKQSLVYNDFSWYPKVNISFEHRDKSSLTLYTLFNPQDNSVDLEEMNTDIWSVFKKAWIIVNKVCQEKGLEVSVFINYLLDRVQILRINVPKETNLNHYFEIMNSRGEQLEQHEIVKTWLMSSIKNDNEALAAFNLLWEACSNMDRYVQMNFSKEIRIFLFENNGTGKVIANFDDLVNRIKLRNTVVDKEEKSLCDLFEDSKNNISYKKPWEDNLEKDLPETYHSLITFSNFLLHVLKLLRPNDSEVILDDKRLTKIFHEVIKTTSDQVEFAKNFIMSLLEIRYLFDTFIIKRKQDKWSLKKMIPQISSKDQYYYKDTFSADNSENGQSGNNHKIIMLLSMFHVSAPTQIYKHWMNAALFYIYNHQDTNALDYADYLWGLAKSYMIDRYLSPEKAKVSFEDIIYQSNGKNTNSSADICWKNINIDEYPQVGEHVENFVFNFYDYLLWKRTKDSDFEFTYRTSVEHFYPQHPADKESLDFDHLHSFGNLCLISRGMNSKFTNNLPGAKYHNFGSEEAMKSYSLKLNEMMNCIKNKEIWDENKITQKEKEAKKMICDELFKE